MNVAHFEARSLEAISNQVEEVDELAEHQALRRGVLHAQVAQLLDERLDLGRRPPCVQVETPEDPLARIGQILL